MPVNIIIGVFSIFVALALYSMGVWGAFRAKVMGRKNLALIWAGFGFDVIATIMMAVQARSFMGDPHTVLGVIGLLGMLATACVVTWAMYRMKEDILVQAARWAPAPWAVWLVSFTWGLIVRGIARLVH